jgi:transposase-like protein
MKKKYTPEFKGKVALELARGGATAASICSRLEVHPTQAAQWKQRLVRGAHELFGDRAAERRAAEQQRLTDELYAQIGRLTQEVAWLKKRV